MHGTTQTVLCDDFNARMGTFTGDHDPPGVRTCVRYEGSSIIDVFLSTDELDTFSLTIYKDLSLDSDHKMMDFDFQIFTPPNSILENPRLIWHLDFLKTDRQPKILTSAQTFIEGFSLAICSAIYNSLDIHFGQKQHWHDPLHDFWTEEMTSAFHQMIRRISRIEQERSVKPIFTTPSGPQDASNTMVQHSQHSFNGDIRPDFPSPPIDLLSLAPFVNIPPFTIDSINTVMNILPSRKAPSVDHLRIETLQPLQSILLPLLYHLFYLCWRWSFTPQNWRLAQVIPIHKKGSPTDSSDPHSPT
ncbi:MAG: hypothetical protein EXX96DRAFT_617156 [Benjaminiella poitrasii]|nr:MAG: hypothetical protein EXX96DRAFT_617156 [Benjaminiella poitrasii]